jgi:hypothetical protein
VEEQPTSSLAAKRARLRRLKTERCEALQAGVPADADYIGRLSAAIQDAERDYTICAVGEMASQPGEG